VTNTVNKLLTAITNSGVADVSARIAKCFSYATKLGLLGGGLEAVTWMMAVLVKLVARNAEIIIFAGSACDKFSLGEYLDAAVAGAVWLLWGWGISNGLLLFHERTRHPLSGSQLSPGQVSNSLCGAPLKGTILDKSLDHPVAFTRTVHASVNAR